MLHHSRLCNSPSWKRRFDREIVTNAVYAVILSYLILYSIFNSLYLDKGLPSTYYQPGHYDIENVAIKPIGCSFFISGCYERTPRFICYLLLVFTVVIRKHKWLAAGAAASVLTYSGVAAIHLIVLFATNNRLDLPKAKLHCESLPIPGASTPFVACAGVEDPDVSLSMSIVLSGMLGALPIVAWSTTFRGSTSKAILIFWLLLLAVGHTFYILTDSDGNLNFQICPKDYIEPLPTTKYQAPILDQAWRDSFSSLVSTAQQSSKSPENGSEPACIYSCFTTAGYVGRGTQDISVYDGVGVQHPVFKSRAANRLGGIIFWWGYTLLAILTFFTTENQGRLPKWFYKLLFSIEYRPQLIPSRWIWKPITNIAIKGAEDSIVTIDSSEATTLVKIHITVLKMVQLFTQVVSLGVFCGSIIQEETQNAQAWSVLSQEPFVAVGQWGNLAVVLLVLVAAGVHRIWAGTEAGSTASKKGKSSPGDDDDDDDDPKSGYWRDIKDEDVEKKKEDWDWRIGYAS